MHRKLIKLVRQHGERKWAIVSEKLEGRAGKQCRERWHNHLRPDIKVFSDISLYIIAFFFCFICNVSFIRSRVLT